MRLDDPRHGTRAGYIAHWRANQDSCAPCKDAERVYQRPRRKPKADSHTLRTCGQCGVEFLGLGIQTYCSPACRASARNKRRRDAIKPTPILLSATTYRFGAWAPKQKTVKVRTLDNGRHGRVVQAECPNCEHFVMVGNTAYRVCRECGTEAVFNDEEWGAVHAGLISA